MVPEARLHRLLRFSGAVPFQRCAEIIAFLEPTTARLALRNGCRLGGA